MRSEAVSRDGFPAAAPRAEGEGEGGLHWDLAAFGRVLARRSVGDRRSQSTAKSKLQGGGLGGPLARV